MWASTMAFGATTALPLHDAGIHWSVSSFCTRMMAARRIARPHRGLRNRETARTTVLATSKAAPATPRDGRASMAL
jgi:hypothetical protein